MIASSLSDTQFLFIIYRREGERERKEEKKSKRRRKFAYIPVPTLASHEMKTVDFPSNSLTKRRRNRLFFVALVVLSLCFCSSKPQSLGQLLWGTDEGVNRLPLGGPRGAARSRSDAGGIPPHRLAFMKWLGSLNRVPAENEISEIKPKARSRPFGLHFISKSVDDVCEADGEVVKSLAVNADDAALNLLMTPSAFALPSMKCPSRNVGAIPPKPTEECGVFSPYVPKVLWDGTKPKSDLDTYSKEEHVFDASGLSHDPYRPSPLSWVINPTVLDLINRGRISMKAIKYVLAGIGCDQLMEVRPVNREYNSIRAATAEEHLNDVQVLVLGGAFARTNQTRSGEAGLADRNDTISGSAEMHAFYHVESSYVAEILTGELDPEEHPIAPRVGILTLVNRNLLESTLQEAKQPARSVAGDSSTDKKGAAHISFKCLGDPLSPDMSDKLKARGLRPSSAAMCAYGSGSKRQSSKGESRTLIGALSAMPPHTFNAVLAFDGLLASVPNDLLCETVRALLRVTKIGGAVWVGHEADGERVRILSECRFSACRSNGASDAGPDKGYSVGLAALKESFWYRYFISVESPLMKQRPSSSSSIEGGASSGNDNSKSAVPRPTETLSYVWRKVPLAEEDTPPNQRSLHAEGKGPRKLKEINLSL